MSELKIQYNEEIRKKYKKNNKNRFFDPNIKKKCNKCGVIYPATLDYFHKDVNSKNGLHHQCKKCRNKKGREKRKNESKKDKEKRAIKQKEYYKKNKEKILTHHKKWQKNNLHKIKEWRKKNFDKCRNYRLKTSHKITLKQYNEIFKNQKGKCAICGKKEIHKNQYGIISLSVDHDHKTGKIRGLLCIKCNYMLGYGCDNPLILIKGSKYLKNGR